MCPIWLPVFSYFQMNQNWVQKSILAWLWPHFHLVFWMRQVLNPQRLDHESSSLTTRPDCRPFDFYLLVDKLYWIETWSGSLLTLIMLGMIWLSIELASPFNLNVSQIRIHVQVLQNFRPGVAKVRPSKDFLWPLYQILDAQRSYFCNKEYPKLTSIKSY